MKPAEQNQIIRKAYADYREALKEFAPPPWEEMDPRHKAAFEVAMASIIRKVDPAYAADHCGPATQDFVRTMSCEMKRITRGERVIKDISITQPFKPTGQGHFQPTGAFRFDFVTEEPGSR